MNLVDKLKKLTSFDAVLNILFWTTCLSTLFSTLWLVSTLANFIQNRLSSRIPVQIEIFGGSLKTKAALKDAFQSALSDSNSKEHITNANLRRHNFLLQFENKLASKASLASFKYKVNFTETLVVSVYEPVAVSVVKSGNARSFLAVHDGRLFDLAALSSLATPTPQKLENLPILTLKEWLPQSKTSHGIVPPSLQKYGQSATKLASQTASIQLFISKSLLFWKLKGIFWTSSKGFEVEIVNSSTPHQNPTQVIFGADIPYKKFSHLASILNEFVQKGLIPSRIDLTDSNKAFAQATNNASIPSKL